MGQLQLEVFHAMLWNLAEMSTVQQLRKQQTDGHMLVISSSSQKIDIALQAQHHPPHPACPTVPEWFWTKIPLEVLSPSGKCYLLRTSGFILEMLTPYLCSCRTWYEASLSLSCCVGLVHSHDLPEVTTPPSSLSTEQANGQHTFTEMKKTGCPVSCEAEVTFNGVCSTLCKIIIGVCAVSAVLWNSQCYLHERCGKGSLKTKYL